MLPADPAIFTMDSNNMLLVTANDPTKVGIYNVLIKGVLKMVETAELLDK